MEINFKDFKDKISEMLYKKVGERLEEIREEFAQAVFEEESEAIKKAKSPEMSLAYSIGKKHGYDGKRRDIKLYDGNNGDHYRDGYYAGVKLRKIKNPEKED